MACAASNLLSYTTIFRTKVIAPLAGFWWNWDTTLHCVLEKLYILHKIWGTQTTVFTIYRATFILCSYVIDMSTRYSEPETSKKSR